MTGEGRPSGAGASTDEPGSGADLSISARAAGPLAFLGSPEVAASTLAALIEAGHDVRLVVTNPDRRRDRRAEPTPNPVKQVALANGIAIAERPDELIGSKCALGIVVAYGRLIRPNVLAELPLVNVHFSLLPRWRGAAPVERAILAGDETTGVCLMALEETLDTGPVYARASTPIGPHETVDELRRRLGVLGTELLLAELASTEAFGHLEPQSGEPTYAEKVTVDDRRLDFTEPAIIAERRVRVGRAWTTFRGRRLLVHAAQAIAGTGAEKPGELAGTIVGTAGGALRLFEVQAEGRARVDVESWLAGARPQPGELLGA